MYQLTYIISPLLDETGSNSAVANIRGFINDLGAEIKKEQVGEKRKFAYPIKKQLFGYYITVDFNLDPEKIEEVQKFLKHHSDVLRSLIINQGEIKIQPTKAKIDKKPKTIPPKTVPLQKAEKIKIEELDKKLEEILEE